MICTLISTIPARFELEQHPVANPTENCVIHTGWMASAPRLIAAAMMLGMLRYDSVLGASPMHTASSASCAEAITACPLLAVTCVSCRIADR